MGLIWKKRRHAAVPPHALTIEGMPGALPHSWPILSYLGQYWCLLKVVTEKPRQPFYLYRSTDGKSVHRYHLMIHHPFVLTGVGSMKTYFWAETRTHQPLAVTYTGIKKAGPLVKDKQAETAAELSKYQYKRT